MRVRPHSAISRTSPPAQKARSEEDPIRMAYTCGSRAQGGTPAAMAARMSVLSALSAAGRFQGDQACRVVLPQDDVGRRICRRALTCICSRFPVFHCFFFHRLFPIFAINFWILAFATNRAIYDKFQSQQLRVCGVGRLRSQERGVTS